MGAAKKYYTIAYWGAGLTLLFQIILFFTVDPYVVAVLSPFYAVWIMVYVVGWRKEYPRK